MSHASEDKATVVEPLAALLAGRKVRVWFDKHQLRLGDSLTQKIDEGLTQSRFGVVVLSPDFFAKDWPQRELDGLVARETTLGVKVILPVWHNLTSEEITKYSPTLAGKLAARTVDGLDVIADQIAEVLRTPTTEPGQVVALAVGGGTHREDRTVGPGELRDEVLTLIRAKDEIGLDELLRTEHRTWNRALTDFADESRGRLPDNDSIRDAWGRMLPVVERRAAALLPLGTYSPERLAEQVRLMGRTLEDQPVRDGYALWGEVIELATSCVGYIVGGWLAHEERFEALTPLVSASWECRGVSERLIWLPGEAQHAVGDALTAAPDDGGRWLSPFWRYLTGLLPDTEWLADRYPEIAADQVSSTAALSVLDLVICMRAIFDGCDRAQAWFDLDRPNHGTGGPVRFVRRVRDDRALRARVAHAMGVDLRTFEERAAAAAQVPYGWPGHVSHRDQIVSALSEFQVS